MCYVCRDKCFENIYWIQIVYKANPQIKQSQIKLFYLEVDINTTQIKQKYSSIMLILPILALKKNDHIYQTQR